MNEEIDFEELAPWLVGFLTIAGYILRVLLLGMKGMWLDETFSVWLASHSIADMLQWIVKVDQHPPLYYWLLHYWIGIFGATPYYARLLSVFFGAATIPIVYLIGKRMSGVALGLAAAVFLALSPFHIYFAQETRMYTLLTFNVAVAMYALVRLLTDPRAARPIGSQFREYLHAWRTAEPLVPEKKDDLIYQELIRNQTGWRGWISRHRWSPIQTVETDLAWVALVVFTVATLLTHNTAVFFPIAANLFVLGLMLYQRSRKSGAQTAFQAPSFANWIKAQVAILILWSPWIPSFIRQAGTVDRRFWIPAPTWDAVIQVLKSFLNASGPLPATPAMIIWILYLLVIGVGLVYFRRKVSQLLFLVVLFAIPLLGELLVSIQRPIFLGRTLIWITIPLFLVLGAGIAQLKFRFVMIAVAGILGFVNLFSAGDYYRFYQKEDWSTPAGYVARFAEKDDLILFNSNFVEIPFDYYFEPYRQQYSLQVVERGVPQDLFESGVPEPEMTSADVPGLLASLSGHKRVWLVYSHNSYTDPQGLIPQALASQMKLTRTRDFLGGQVQLYETP